MKRLALLIFMAACSVLVLAVSSPSAVSGTELTIISKTTLTADHVGTIVIAADNIKLDCAGHSVTASDP